MKSRTIAIATSIAALSFTAVPVASAAAKPHHKTTVESRSDRSRDLRGSSKDKSRDKGVENSRDKHDR